MGQWAELTGASKHTLLPISFSILDNWLGICHFNYKTKFRAFVKMREKHIIKHSIFFSGKHLLGDVFIYCT